MIWVTDFMQVFMLRAWNCNAISFIIVTSRLKAVCNSTRLVYPLTADMGYRKEWNLKNSELWNWSRPSISSNSTEIMACSYFIYIRFRYGPRMIHASPFLEWFDTVCYNTHIRYLIKLRWPYPLTRLSLLL